MRPSRPSLLLVCPRLMLLMSPILLAGLAGCGPASVDNAPTLGPRTSLGEPPSSQKNPSPRTDAVASAARSATASPVPLASEPVPLTSKNGTGSVPEEMTGSVGNSPKAAPIPSAEPANPMDARGIPEWLAKDLDSPDVDTRSRALETWVLIAPVGSIDPLILAYGNGDERVRTRAIELMQEDWARAADRGQ